VSGLCARAATPGLLALVLMSATAACTSPPEDYATKVAAARAAKDENFKTASDSPVPADKRAILIPLSYFPIDENFAIPATLEPSDDRKHMQVPTSTGKIRDLESVGTLKFSWKGQPLRLTAFLEEGERRLFVPFTDMTTGTETYAAGRYLNLDPTATGIYVGDQRRLSPVLLLQRRVRLPVPSGRESIGDCGSRRRACWRSRLRVR
jgi:uncharacterized protein (DUF1684 family)